EAAQFGPSLVVREVQHHRALAPGVDVPPERVFAGRGPAGRLDEDHLRPELGEEEPGELAPLVGEVEDPEVGEHAGHGRTVRDGSGSWWRAPTCYKMSRARRGAVREPPGSHPPGGRADRRGLPPGRRRGERAG